CNSPNGSVSGYCRPGERVEPVREIDARENAVFAQFAQRFQDGVVQAADIAAPLLRRHAVSSAELKPLAMHVWRALIQRPPEQLVQIYASAPQHDVFGTGGMFERARVPRLGTMLMAIIDGRRRRDVIHYIRRTQWTPGIEGLGLGPIDRLALRSAYWLAHKYKRLHIEYRKWQQG